jgi:hypothetical protein
MNKLIQELAEQAGYTEAYYESDHGPFIPAEFNKQKFAELIVEELRNVVVEVYHKTPLELCGPLLTADEQIAKHFGAH